jgi:hypothetical protein
VTPGRTALILDLAALAITAALLACAPSRAAVPTPEYLGRPIYSDPTSGLQLPPTCIIEPTWRSRINGAELEVWVVNCDGVARVWLLKRQTVEMISAREARLRFQVIDGGGRAEETAGDSWSVQCTAAGEESGVVVRGAHWRSTGRELHLASARGALRVNVARHRLVDADLTSIDCTRFPEREAMMRKLQQTDRPNR